MSLDVYLEGEEETVSCECVTCGHVHERREAPEVYWRNITHNLNRMAQEAGVYEACWRPDENGMTWAADLIPALSEGLRKLRESPSRFREFNPSNGWGSYEGLVDFVASYLGACRDNPGARVRVSR